MFVFRLWVKEAFVGLWRNLWWSMSAIFLAVLCLLMFAASYASGMNAEHLAGFLDEKLEIKAFILDSETNYDEMEQEITSWEEVKTVEFESKETALDKLKTDMGEDADILEALDTNPLPASFIVKIHTPEEVSTVVERLNGLGSMEEVKYGEEHIEKMLTATEFLRNAGIILTALAAVFTIFVVISVIRLNIIQRKNEIRVKQLIGASMFTIRFPFVLEALVLTVSSSVIVYYLFSYGYQKLIDSIKSAVPYAPILDAQPITQEIVLPLIGLAIIIAVVGSIFSVRRFLKK